MVCHRFVETVIPGAGSRGRGADNATIEAFGDRWSLLVLGDILFADRRYFRELQAGSEEGIAANILADRLKRLVKLGLLTREDTRGRPAGALQPD